MTYYCVAVQPYRGKTVDFEVSSETSRGRTDEVLSFLRQQVEWTVVQGGDPVLTQSGDWVELRDVLGWAFGSIEILQGVIRFHN